MIDDCCDIVVRAVQKELLGSEWRRYAAIKLWDMHRSVVVVEKEGRLGGHT